MNQYRQALLLKLRRPGNLLFACLFFSAACSFLVFMPLFQAEEPFGADLPAEKMLFFAVVILLILILLISAFYFLARTDQAQMVGDFIFKDGKRRTLFLQVAGVGFVLCWMGYFFPSYLISQAVSAYLFWIKPILSSAGWFFASVILMIHFESAGRIDLSVVFNKPFLRTASAALIFFTVVFIFMVKTGLGISVQEDYWYGAGVPVLWTQIFAALLFGILFSWVRHHTRFFKETRIDTVIFILLWLVAAYAWGSEPLQPSHFMPDTGINEIYPYSDSATFDVGSQYALIGQGLFNGQYFDRSLYSAFLTYLHALGGQNFETLMFLQAVMYAVFPSILYLLGKELHDRTLGVSLGILMIFRGINAIFGASLIDLAGPKMMLTDFPTAIGISLIILFIVKWLKTPGKPSYIIWAGCFIGLTLLLRTHVILLLPFIILYIGIYFRNNRNLWIYGLVFLIFGMLVSTLPVDIQNQKKGVPMFYIYYSRIQDVLKARYNLLNEPGANLPLGEGVKELSGLRHERLNPYKDDQSSNCSSRPCAIVNHFFHNFAGSVLYLPASFALDDFRHTVKEAAPYWGKDWTGEGVRPQNYLLLFINFAVISIGISAVWTRQRLLGIFPLLIYFIYILSNSLAFTSGGRYLAPVDWIICIYYMAGLLKISFWALSQTGFYFKLNEQNFEIKETSEIVPTLSLRNMAGVFVVIFMIGSLIPLADSIFPRRYPRQNTEDVLSTLVEHGLLPEANLTQTAVDEFLTQPDARLISGRLLYPRFYSSGKGEPGLDYPYTALDYRRLVFLVIGSFRSAPNGVIFPIENVKPAFHASDVIVLGCVTDNFLDAAVVFILSEPIQVYVRSTDLVLQCPLPNP